MKDFNLKEELISLLPDFEVEDREGGFFGTKQITAKTYRDEDKNLIVASCYRYLYVSSVMYEDDPTKESFRYMIIWTRGRKRFCPFKTFVDVEIDKVYVEGYTDELLIENLKIQLTKKGE